MRAGLRLVGLLLASIAAPAVAGEQVLTGPIPAWVAPAPPLDLAALKAGNIIPRFDQQVRIEGDTMTMFVDNAVVISSPEVLAARGTVKMNWQPAHGDVTFHRIEIIRDGQVIDTLRDGAGFSVLRREAGLEQQIVDGTLTAVKHIEGLRIGDVLRSALSVSLKDPVLAGKVSDGLFLVPAPAQIKFGRARLVWDNTRPLHWKLLGPGTPPAAKPLDAKWTELTIALPGPKVPEMPKNVPGRFQPLPLLQFSTFAAWDDVAKVMAPLYKVEGTISAGSDLARRVDAIAARSADPRRRVADALQLVQEEVRYQLVALGTGNYVPQTPAETWAKRYGDCKAKTLLLMAILDRLGIRAEPVLASTKNGDALAGMLPAASVFDHVFVRAEVGGEELWLDGTMAGSRLADLGNVPRFGRVLPLFTKGDTLVDLPRRANARPDLAVHLAYDSAVGPHLPAPFQLTLRYAGAYAAAHKVADGPSYDEKLGEFALGAAKTWVGSETITKPLATYDPATAVWTVVVKGVASVNWEYRDGRYALGLAPSLKVALDAPRDRASWRQLPALIDQPWTAEAKVEFLLPDGGEGAEISGGDAQRVDLPAVTWQRSVALAGGKVTESIVSRESGAEIGAETLSSATKAIADAMAKTSRIALTASYPHWPTDAARMRGTASVGKVGAIYDQRIAEVPDDASRLADRAWFKRRLLDYAGAEADYTRSIAIDASAARYLNRSDHRSQRGDHAGALKDAQAAYALDEGNKQVRNQLAMELAAAGRIDEALELLPADPDVATDDGIAELLHRAFVLELANRHGDAVALLDVAIEKRASSAELRNARCWYNGLRNSSLDAALDDCNRAIELASNPANFLDSRGAVYFRSGQLAKAKADYEAALAVAPDQASSLFMSGVILTRLGDTERATAALQQARAVAPGIAEFYGRFGIKP